MKDYTFINFTRDIGKLITVNYMMSKDSVKKRLSRDSTEGMSFTEFTYQLLQGYDFLYLYRNMGVKLQLGGADQWGNITTGTELIRRSDGGAAYGLTCPLITKADGGKFGKTESGNVWLDADRTSPYQFYQFWLNVSDEDAEKYIKIFTMLGRETIEEAVETHRKAPETRHLQRLLAREVTIMVHGQEGYDNAVAASEVLFGKSATEALKTLDEKTFLSLFEGVPQFPIPASALPLDICEALAVSTGVFPSKGECRKLIQGGGLSINKEKITDPASQLTPEMVLNGKYILIQKGKKNYTVLRVE